MDKKDFEALKAMIKAIGACIIILQLLMMGMFYFGFTRESVEESLMYEEEAYDEEGYEEDTEETWDADGTVDEKDESGEA